MSVRSVMTFFVTLVGVGLLTHCGSPVDQPPVVISAPPPEEETHTQSIETAPAAIQEYGKSVVIIELAEGSAGSGFFVTPKLLFTNHHVTTRGRCHRGGCDGVIALRSFSEKGELQLFPRLRPVAQNAALDFALLEVVDHEAPSALPIATEDELETLLKEPVAVIGHPLGGPQKWTTARVVSQDGSDINLQSPIIHGNSGGPLIHVASGKVVGIATSIHHDVGTYRLGSYQLPYLARAIALPAITKMIRNHFPQTANIAVPDWQPRLFREHFLVTLFSDPQSPRNASPLGNGLLEPLSSEGLFASRLSHPASAEGFLDALAAQFRSLNEPQRSLRTLVRSLIRVELRRGERMRPSPAFFHFAHQTLSLEKHDTDFQTLDNFYHEEKRATCARKYENTSNRVQTMGSICFQTDIAGIGGILNAVRRAVEPMSLQEKDRDLAVIVLSVIEQQLLLRTQLTATDIDDLQALLTKVHPLLKRGLPLASWERMDLLLRRYPQLLLGGGLAASFRHPI